MPEVMDYQEIMKQIWSRYDDSPEGWTFLQVDSERKDRFRLFFSNGDETWYVEAFQTANRMKGKGTRFEDESIQNFVDKEDFDVSSGVRPLKKSKLKEFMKKGQVPREHIETILESEPQSTEDMKSKIGVIGPQYMVSSDDIELSSSQKDLKERLSRMVDSFEKDHLRYIG